MLRPNKIRSANRKKEEKEKHTWSEHIDALAKVGEVSTLITESGSANCNGLLGGSRGVVASILVVITGGDSEMEAIVDGSIDGTVQCGGLATAKTHVRNRAFVSRLARGLDFRLSSFELLLRGLAGKVYTCDNIGHGTRAIGPEDFDCDDIGFLGDTILAGRNGTRAVRAMSIIILVNVVQRNSLSPRCATLKLHVLNVDASINDIHVHAFTTLFIVQVLCKGAEGKLGSVAHSRKTLVR
jgi:hypothetical protein